MNFCVPQIQYGWIERAAMRLLFAFVIERQIPASLSHLTISHPNGLARLFDLGFLLNHSVFAVCRLVLYAALILYVLRVGWSLALPYLTLLSIAVGTIVNSHGAIAHYMQIVSLVLCAQTAAHFYHRLAQRNLPAQAPRSDSEDRVIFWSQQAIVATYLVSALTKLIHTKGAWFFQSPLIGVQIIKTTDQDYYDRLDADAYNAGSAVAEWIAQHPLLVGVVLGSGLLLELFAPLALLGRRFALVIGLSLLAFHESIHRVMQLHFFFNEYLLWIYLVNVPFWSGAIWLWIRRRPAIDGANATTYARR